MNGYFNKASHNVKDEYNFWKKEFLDTKEKISSLNKAYEEVCDKLEALSSRKHVTHKISDLY